MADMDPKTIKELRNALGALKEEAKDYRDIMEDNETFMNMILDKRLEAYKEEARAHKEKIAQYKAEMSTASDAEKEHFKDAIANEEELLRSKEKLVKDPGQQTRAVKKTTAEMMQMTQVYGDHEIVTIDLMARMVKFGMTLTSVAGAVGILAGAFGGIFNTIINLALEVDKTSSSLMKQTGINRELADSMIISQRETARLGVEVEEQAEAFQALFGAYTDFSLQSESVQLEITKTTAVLEKLGVANSDMANGIQNTTKFFGQTGIAATATARDLADFASIVGVAPQQMAADFSSAGESLAKLGSGGVRAFKDLAIASKITGIEINKLMQITDKFDTFEGAAEQAGKLNAALGGNFVNAMDLMMSTDPIERFEMIRDSIMSQGRSFDDMSYYQRKFFTEAAGLDSVGDLAKLMSGNFNDLAGAVNMSSSEYAKMEEKAKAVQNVQEELQNTLRALIPVIQPLLEEFRSIAESISENDELLNQLKDTFEVIGKFALFFAENLGTIVTGLGLMFGATMVNGMIKMFTGVNVLGKGMGFLQNKVSGLAGKIPGLGNIFGTTAEAAEVGGRTMADSMTSMSSAARGLSEHGEDAAAGIELMGESSSEAAKSLKSMVGPIIALGVSVAIAAFGMGFLVESFGKAGDNATAAVFGILAVGVALAGLMFVAMKASAPLAISAGAILAIGAAVAIAAIGVSVLVESFKGLNTEFMAFAGFALVIAVFAKGAVLLGAAGWGAAAGVALLSAALYTLSLSMAALGEEMSPFNTFVSGMNSLVANITGLTLVKTEIEAISKAMKGIPATAGVSVQTMAAMSSGFNAAPANITFKPQQTILLEIDGEQFRTKIKTVQGEEVVARAQKQ
jgi:hypothetical protein